MLSLDAMVDQDLFICPRCASSLRPEVGRWRCTGAPCRYADELFPVVSGVPALVDFEHSVLDADRLRAVEGASEVNRRLRFDHAVRQRLLHPANTTAPAKVARMLELLRADDATVGRRPRILVIGGGAVGSGLQELYADPTVDLISFDIYASPAVQFIGDGHAIPLTDGCIDGVVIQAVLEHVLEPTVVAKEIHRVLRSGGIVYADSPFIQQVHEGPYDFTRFTDSGHRCLFRSFEWIDSGSVAGAGTALRWSIDYFVRALTRSVKLGRIVQLCFIWLSFMDRILDPKHSLDGASSVFFLGRKTTVPITEAEIINYYQGGMRRSSS
jgi:SAM-dependent methyltransferase